MYLTELSEEQIQDYQEIQDSLIIPLRHPTAISLQHCRCQQCRRFRAQRVAELEQSGLLNSPITALQVAGKISTKLRRNH
ncbi:MULTISPECIES: hypothetical protein [unclassified Spirosoma]|uniref:hypothetical protein n=1 Tax=unclassified Spirosoma TaxID=2621999 RepID=UPI00095AB568|nr:MULTISPECIES: hypothetical protein [unclassified Spirosoma]MBN8820779.1 hypothetical protein [Spirosoma sp.]OJW76371.1 MAG: hypothetical protein BGO59_22895 [Spirosoma sp. 48-14]